MKLSKKNIILLINRALELGLYEIFNTEASFVNQLQIDYLSWYITIVPNQDDDYKSFWAIFRLKDGKCTQIECGIIRNAFIQNESLMKKMGY